jgi:hypothetical protein
VINIFKQLKDKIHVFYDEITKWITIINDLNLIYSQVIKELHYFHLSFKYPPPPSSSSRPSSSSIVPETNERRLSASLASASSDISSSLFLAFSAEREDILKGLALIQKQLFSKKNRTMNGIITSAKDIYNLSIITKDLTEVMRCYKMIISIPIESLSFLSIDNKKEQLFNQMKEVLSLLEDCEVELSTLFVDEKVSKDQQPMMKRATDKKEDEETEIFYDLNDRGDSYYSCCPISSLAATIPSSSTSSSSSSNAICWKAENDEKHDCSFILNEPTLLTKFLLTSASYQTMISIPSSSSSSSGIPPFPSSSGSNYASHASLPSMNIARSGNNSTASLHSSASQKGRSVSSNSLKLPCGINGFNDCDGEIITTVKCLSDVMDWTTLLKKNPPEKFLKRPPVRFVFDVIKHLSSLYSLFFTNDIQEADWSMTGDSKELKIIFLDNVIDLISKETASLLIINPVDNNSSSSYDQITTSANILTGSEPQLTNKLFQHLAIILYNKYYKSDEGAAEEQYLHEQPSSATFFEKVPEETIKLTSISITSYIQSFKISFSLNGIEWKNEETYQISEKEKDKDFIVSFKAPIYIRYIQIIPLSFTFASSPVVNNSLLPFRPAFQFGLFGLVSSSPSCSSSSSYLLTSKYQQNKIQSILLSYLQIVVEKSLFLINSLLQIEQDEQKKKQEEMKRNMEQLALEKSNLQQLLMNEKESLENNNQNLQEQLTKCLLQLTETNNLLEKEQSLNSSLQASRMTLEDEKTSLLTSLHEKDDENMKLSTSLLKLQTSYEKTTNQLTEISNSLNEKENIIEQLNQDLQYSLQQRNSLENEKEEYLSSISILIEERDAARSHEELLFEQLTETKDDLEKLQESYVILADRCNDAQDEVSELKDQIASLQELLKSKQAAATQQQQPSLSYQNGSSSSSSRDGGFLKSNTAPSGVPPVFYHDEPKISPRSEGGAKKSLKSSSKSFNSMSNTSSPIGKLPQQGLLMSEDDVKQSINGKSRVPNPASSSRQLSETVASTEQHYDDDYSQADYDEDDFEN